MSLKTRPTDIAFVSLGCDKNTIDSEIMLHRLLERGYRLVREDAEAEVVIINTCGFIQDAQEESINMIIEMGQYKETGRLKKLIVTGCLAERFTDEILEDLPEVDAVVGTGSYEQIVDVVDRLLEEDASGIVVKGRLTERDLSYQPRLISTVGYYEYVKIAEGCDNRCTYCAIPMIRGPYRSRRAEDILAEVRDLAANDVTELMIVAQDITKYGRDRTDGIGLPELLHEICQVDGIHWVRLLYCYPEDVTDALIETMADEPKILPYIDIPIQHCSDTVLKRMHRRHTKAMLFDVLRRLRERIPDIAVRTTLISGFPGESEEEFEELCDFIKEARFERLGVFAYSQEEGTPAARMPDQIPDEVKNSRKDVLMQVQQEISAACSAAYIGRKLEVIIEGELPGEEEDAHIYTCRSFRDAPDIDGFVFVRSRLEHNSGEYIWCRVTDAGDYDLIGEEEENGD